MITFQLREDEFLEAMAPIALWPRSRLVAMAVQGLVALGIGIGLAFSTGASGVLRPAGWMLICMVLIGGALIAFLRPVAFRRKFVRRYKELQNRLIAGFSWNDAGIAVKREGKEHFGPWTEFTKHYETEHLIVLISKRAVGSGLLILPKRVLDAAGLNELLGIIKMRVGA